MSTSTHQEAVAEAVNRAGGQTALARKLKVKQGHVWDWLNRPSGPPLEHCYAIEIETGVPCESLRGDVQWQRDDEGRVIAYTVPLASNDSEAGNGSGQNNNNDHDV